MIDYSKVNPKKLNGNKRIVKSYLIYFAFEKAFPYIAHNALPNLQIQFSLFPRGIGIFQHYPYNIYYTFLACLVLLFFRTHIVVFCPYIPQLLFEIPHMKISFSAP